MRAVAAGILLTVSASAAVTSSTFAVQAWRDVTDSEDAGRGN